MDIVLVKMFFLKFLLMPLLALTLVVLVIFIKKKNAIIKNKTLIFYVLIGALILAIPGFLGFAGNTFSPYGYLFSQIYYLITGAIHVNLLQKYFKNRQAGIAISMLLECLITLICMVLGAYIYFLIYNWISPFKGYAVMSATSILIFALPLLFYYCYIQYIAIPFNIYKTWQYQSTVTDADFDGIDFNKLMIINLELTKDVETGRRFKIKAKSPSEVTLGSWFNRVIEDYNFKHPDETIMVNDDLGEPYSWIFYTKKSFLHFRRYLDFEKVITANKIFDQDIVICKRVIQHSIEGETIKKHPSQYIN